MYKVSYTGDGATTEYVFAFPFFQVADVHITLDNVAVTNGCTVVPNDDFTGGRVIFTVAPDNGVAVDIFRRVSLSRVIDYQPTAKIDPEDLNNDFNFLLAAIQDLHADIAPDENNDDNGV